METDVNVATSILENPTPNVATQGSIQELNYTQHATVSIRRRPNQERFIVREGNLREDGHKVEVFTTTL